MQYIYKIALGLTCRPHKDRGREQGVHLTRIKYECFDIDNYVKKPERNLDGEKITDGGFALVTLKPY